MDVEAGKGAQVQLKKNVRLDADGKIEVTADVAGGEVDIEETNLYTAGTSILVSSGAGGKTGVKKLSVFTAPATIIVTSGGECKVEDFIKLTVDCT